MGGLIWLLIFAGLFYFMMRFGCGAHMVHGHGHRRDRPPTQHDLEGLTDLKDPVCGMSVSRNQGYTSGYTEVRAGTRYWFCSRSCLDKFDADPGRYTGVGQQRAVT